MLSVPKYKIKMESENRLEFALNKHKDCDSGQIQSIYFSEMDRDLVTFNFNSGKSEKAKVDDCEDILRWFAHHSPDRIFDKNLAIYLPQTDDSPSSTGNNANNGNTAEALNGRLQRNQVTDELGNQFLQICHEAVKDGAEQIVVELEQDSTIVKKRMIAEIEDRRLAELRCIMMIAMLNYKKDVYTIEFLLRIVRSPNGAPSIIRFVRNGLHEIKIVPEAHL